MSRQGGEMDDGRGEGEDVSRDERDNLTSTLESSLYLLNGVKLKGKLRSQRSAVTTEWKVKWDEGQIARDLMQNFHDGNKGVGGVKIDRLNQEAVAIFGPNEFNVEKLFYLGSEKSKEDGDVGGFGEGFKAASVGLVRDFGVCPICISGRRGLRVRAGRALKGMDLSPLRYDFFDVENETGGTYLLLTGAQDRLIKAVQGSKDYFFDAGMDAIDGKVLYESDKVAVYKCSRADGIGFYRGLQCTRFVDLPVLIQLKIHAAPVEKRVGSDRDRREFKEGALDAYLGALAGALELRGAKACIVLSKHLWTNGHPLLAAIAKRARPAWLEELRASVGDGFDKMYTVSEGMRYYQERDDSFKELIREYEKIGFVRAPSYFAQLGAVSISDVYHQRIREKALKEEEASALRKKEIARAQDASTMKKAQDQEQMARKAAKREIEKLTEQRRSWVKGLSEIEVDRLAILGSLVSALRSDPNPERLEQRMTLVAVESGDSSPAIFPADLVSDRVDEVLVKREVLQRSFRDAYVWACKAARLFNTNSKRLRVGSIGLIGTFSDSNEWLDHLQALARLGKNWEDCARVDEGVEVRLNQTAQAQTDEQVERLVEKVMIESYRTQPGAPQQ